MRTLRLFLEADEVTALAAMAAFERAFEAEGAPVSAFETRQDGPWVAEVLLTVAGGGGEAEVGARARRALEAAGIGLEVRSEPLEPRDWVREGLLFLKPVRASRFSAYGTHDRGRVAPSRTALLVDAASAFGTGHHATTLGCLLAIDAILKQRRPLRVLDVGTGTGILAMAAVKAGAREAVATDIDPVAVAAARRNGRANGVHGRMAFVVADGVRRRAIAARAPFDLLLANILANPLVALAPDLSRVAAPDGLLVLAGFRSADERRVVAPYLARGFVRDVRGVIDDWPTVTLRKRPVRRAVR